MPDKYFHSKDDGSLSILYSIETWGVKWVSFVLLVHTHTFEASELWYMRNEPKTLHGQESQLLHVFINEWMSEFTYLFHLLCYKLRTLGHLAGP